MELLIAVPVFTVLFYLFNKLLEPRFTESYCRRLLADPSLYDEELPAKLLYASFPKSHIFRSLSLPIPGKEGEEINLGTVAVNRCGVYILCQIHGNGLIENPPDIKWKHMNSGRCTEFDNPFRTQQDARELIEFYAKNAGLGYVKAHSIIIYTDPSLRFTQPSSRSIINAADLNRRMQNIDRLGHLTSAQVHDVCRILSDINSGAGVF